MLGIVKFVHLLALAVWLGQTVFLSFVVAPTLFGTFPTERAGEVMSALFPNYYRAACGCGVLVVLTSLLLWRSARGGFGWLAVGGVALVMLACSLYAGAVLQPRARALRAELHGEVATVDARAEFDLIHRRAVQLNGAVLLGNLLLVVFVVTRVRP